MKMELFSDIVPKTAENFRYESTTNIPKEIYLIYLIDNYVQENISKGTLRVKKTRVETKRRSFLFRRNGQPQGFKNCLFHR